MIWIWCYGSVVERNEMEWRDSVVRPSSVTFCYDIIIAMKRSYMILRDFAGAAAIVCSDYKDKNNIFISFEKWLFILGYLISALGIWCFPFFSFLSFFFFFFFISIFPNCKVPVSSFHFNLPYGAMELKNLFYHEYERERE